ncbi:MAG: transposase [Lewinellaceae bacterium]|nr:transposase [Lewinellaceae bacterium]MCB9338661.1 transposase [Lewinellaceae bacterium]MCB9339442.1 transposase [Lewinellaceae bacterium]MCB9339622.1 transposase [Lewinellaceae bacterium]MCB9341607.1 transposase [Lewinellaceae bacterium]
MMLLVDFPSIVKKYAPIFEHCFSPEGYEHFKKAVSGFIVSDNKTLEAINRMFIHSPRHQASFNKFFNRQNFDLEEINLVRLDMLQGGAGTCFKEKGVLSVDNSLLKHYGRHFDNIYYHFDYVHKCYRWAHDLVTLHYSDDLTDYPVLYRMWEPPDWEAVATYLRGRGFVINEQKWDNRHSQPQQWRNYIRARYKDGRKKHPGVAGIYKTKNLIALELLRKFRSMCPQDSFPVALDTGFTSAELCGAISGELGLDYVGALREDQYATDRDSGNEVPLKELVKKLRQGPSPRNNVQKTGFTYKGEKQICYAYFANHRVRGFDKKQRLVISFLREDLSDRPTFTVTNRLDWRPSGILRIRRHRWPVETYHQEGKAEGLEGYQVRNEKAIQTYVAFVVVAYSMLKCTVHDSGLLSSIQQRLQTETNSTLPFLRRLMKAEGLALLIEHVFVMMKKGQSMEKIFQGLAPCLAYV